MDTRAVRNSYRKLVEGKGVVYKARDLRLDRFVCIRILRAEQRKDEFRKQCFVQEAKSASAPRNRLGGRNRLHRDGVLRRPWLCRPGG